MAKLSKKQQTSGITWTVLGRFAMDDEDVNVFSLVSDFRFIPRTLNAFSEGGKKELHNQMTNIKFRGQFYTTDQNF